MAASSDDDDDERERLVPGESAGRPAATSDSSELPLRAMRRRRWAEVWGMARLNIALMLLNAGYWPTEMLKTPLFAGVGYNSSALIYSFFAIFAFFTPILCARLGVKWVVAIGAIPYLLFVLATVVLLSTIGSSGDPRFAAGDTLSVGLYYVASILLGMAASPLRTGSQVYVRSRALGYDAARPPGGKAANSLGMFSGINSAAFGVSSFVFVTLVGTAIERGLEYTFLYGVCACSVAASLPLFFSVPTTEGIARRYPVPAHALRDMGVADKLPQRVTVCAVCDLFRSSAKLRWLLVPAISSSVQNSYYTGSFTADVVAVALDLEWVGWLAAITIVISSAISPFVGRLSDYWGRLPFYYTGLTINIGSAAYVAINGSDMDRNTIVIFTVLRGFAGATMVVVQAITAENFGDTDAPAAMSALTVVGQMGAATMYMLGPHFSIEAKSRMVVGMATFAGVSLWMAVGGRKKGASQ